MSILAAAVDLEPLQALQIDADRSPAFLSIERLMIEGMLAVVPGMNVKVETVVSLSLNKAEKDPRYCETR